MAQTDGAQKKSRSCADAASILSYEHKTMPEPTFLQLVDSRSLCPCFEQASSCPYCIEGLLFPMPPAVQVPSIRGNHVGTRAGRRQHGHATSKTEHQRKDSGVCVSEDGGSTWSMSSLESPVSTPDSSTISCPTDGGMMGRTLPAPRLTTAASMGSLVQSARQSGVRARWDRVGESLWRVKDGSRVLGAGRT